MTETRSRARARVVAEEVQPSDDPAASPPSPTEKKHEEEYEFFGPHVPGLLVFVLPAVLYGLIFSCNSSGCLQLLPTVQVPGFPTGSTFISIKAVQVFLGWMALVTLLHLVLPGQKAQGVVLPNGGRVTYKLNAFTSLVVTYAASLYFGFFHSGDLALPLSWVYHNYLSLLTASCMFSIALSFYLYATSFKRNALLSGHGSSGYFFYDFWMGRELNPRVGSLDLKEFCELYPGLIGWVIINLAMAHAQVARLGYVTNSMVLVNVFQLYYVVDALWNEKSILTTMDITTDGFGYMLAFGDLAWVPFAFTTCARYLVDYPQDLSIPAVVLILAVKLTGYYIFRGANGQKDVFRRDPTDPSVSHLKTLQTKRGTKLIISGWWGMSRHINYFGDWIMGVAWCLPAGLQGAASVVPYFYCLYFATLLIHRERRDDMACRKKYGADWDTYCKLVPYRIIPYVY